MQNAAPFNKVRMDALKVFPKYLMRENTVIYKIKDISVNILNRRNTKNEDGVFRN